ncbi:MAG: ribokinase [Succinivibrio sp.]|nr:ribokinase [Succinivibrio sp.]
MKKIVVAGSLNYDIFVEAPRRPLKGETLTGYKWYPKFGGKGGNQALSAAKCGCNVIMVGALGNDSFGKSMCNVLTSHKVDTSYLQNCEKTGSGISVAIMDDDGDYGAVIVGGANVQIDNSVFSNETLWKDVGMLILQNEVAEETNLIAAREAKKRGIKVCINAAPVKVMNPELLKMIDILVVNEVEATSICKIKVDSLHSALDACLQLVKDFPYVVVTAGGNGVAYAASDGSKGTVEALKIKLISTHGAGDCFVGALCSRLVNNESIAESVIFANKIAAEHVSTTHEDLVLN